MSYILKQYWLYLIYARLWWGAMWYKTLIVCEFWMLHQFFKIIFFVCSLNSQKKKFHNILTQQNKPDYKKNENGIGSLVWTFFFLIKFDVLWFYMFWDFFHNIRDEVFIFVQCIAYCILGCWNFFWQDLLLL